MGSPGKGWLFLRGPPGGWVRVPRGGQLGRCGGGADIKQWWPSDVVPAGPERGDGQGALETLGRARCDLSPPAVEPLPGMLLFHPSEDTDGAVGLGSHETWDSSPGCPLTRLVTSDVPHTLPGTSGEALPAKAVSLHPLR